MIVVRALIAEDDPRTRRVVRWLLEDEGFTVEELGDGHRVAERAADADVVVIDIAMPGRDGLSVLEDLQVAGMKTPVVVFSAFAQPYLRSAAARLGAAAFVDKVTESARLVDEVRRAAQKRDVLLT